jgi:hypothetical protein
VQIDPSIEHSILSSGLGAAEDEITRQKLFKLLAEEEANAAKAASDGATSPAA